ncbi:MAG: class I SAM-dependent methyltransferase [Verrucomicrobiae bacterium]
MNTNWIIEQSQKNVAQFDQDMALAYPTQKAGMHSAHEYLDTIGGICNYIDACEQVDWLRYLPLNSKVLDIGCGGGWLSALLSRLDEVKTVYALDSSRHYLYNLLPQVMELMQGETEKVIPIEGLFQPLLFEDSHLDAVVASSVLHHADNLESILKEIRRTLMRGGVLIVLNETPRNGFRYLLSVIAATVRIIRNLLLHRYLPLSPSISSSGYLCDPKLGDRDYPMWYWRKAFTASGFCMEMTINTKLATLKRKHGRSLIHFICRAV